MEKLEARIINLEMQCTGERDTYMVPLEIISWPEVDDEIDDIYFDALRESIRQWEVIVPIGISPDVVNHCYIGIYGRRRWYASDDLGYSEIPAIIYESNLSESQITTMRLIENFHRTYPDPITIGMACYDFLKAELNVNSISCATGKLQSYGRKNNRLERKEVEAISTLEDLSLKTYRTLENVISLLKLPTNLQKMLTERSLKPTIGYLLAKHSDNPHLEKILNYAIDHHKSKDEIENLLIEAEGQSPRMT